MDVMQWLEALSYLVTVIGLPLAIAVFIHDRRRERQSDEEEIFLRLSDEYSDFMHLVIDNADLNLLSQAPKGELNEEQLERKHALFAILVSLFDSRRGCGSHGRITCKSGASARIFAPPFRPCFTARIRASLQPSSGLPIRPVRISPMP